MILSNTFFYTFRTNKHVVELEEVLGLKVYVIDKPAQDFEKLLSAIEQSGADSVCGIGMSKLYTRFEEKSFNRVGNSTIDQNSPGEFNLDVPTNSEVKTDSSMTFGPCNYVAFRLRGELKDKKNYFLHLCPEDMGKLVKVGL